VFGRSVDTRDADLHAAEHWSGDEVLGQRATFRVDRQPAALVVTNVKQRDEGLYRCRVDFRTAQTRNAQINLTVVGKTAVFRLGSYFDWFHLKWVIELEARCTRIIFG